MRVRTRVVGARLWKVLLAGVILVFFLEGVDRIAAPTRHVGGIITAERNTWSENLRHRCQISVSTPQGDLTTLITGECRDEWKLGEAVTLEIVFGRLTGMAIVAGSLKHTPTN